MVAECGEWKRKSGVMRNSNALVALSPLLFSLTSLSPAKLDKEISDPITIQVQTRVQCSVSLFNTLGRVVGRLGHASSLRSSTRVPSPPKTERNVFLRPLVVTPLCDSHSSE